MTLTEFLTARLDEDEVAAKAATPGPWTSYIEGRDHWGGDSFIATEGDDLYPYVMVNTTHNPRYAADRDHIARHDPARVLREVEAGRAFLRRYEDAQPAQYPDFDGGYASALEDELQNRAAVYGDHPDYSEAVTSPEGTSRPARR